MVFSNIDAEKMGLIKQKVEDSSTQLQEIVESIVEPYSRDLDNYIQFIRDILEDRQNPPNIQELEDFCMNLSTLIYYASCMCEYLGIRDDISKALYKEIYNTARDTGRGTVADKNSLAELESQQEQLTNICYARAYKVMKAKVESAQELLTSCKKIISRRISEMELTRIGGQ